ncbi:MAG TPA: hypothetical protein PKC29_10785 [Thermodesulfobacteriota bacterium]|nr:hypothetical protein [Thermodesulfobacteriota bacterium]
MPGKKEIASLKAVATTALFILALLQIVFLCSPSPAGAQKAEDVEVGKNVIVVKDYKWASAGMGRPAIMKEITLQNKGKSDFQNIDIEVDFYTHNDIPLGSLRTTIKDVLPAGTEKTFYNVNFGIMSAELQNSIARVAKADLIEKGSPTQAKDLILVKNWEWAGGQYGTEGILKQITLVNKSSENWKDIKIRVDYLGIAGPKVGIRGFTSRAVIHDVLPAHGEKTFHDINMGFRHPDAKTEDISVMSAKPISEKEVKIKTAKKEGKKAVRKKKKKTASAEGAAASAGEAGGTAPSSGEEGLSLSEKYKKRLAEEQGIAPPASGESPAPEVAAEEPGATPPSGEAATGEEGTTAAEEETGGEEEEYEYEYEEDVPIPTEDIVVENFKWGGGVTGTIGMIDEITLRNISTISYSRIELIIEFYSFGSNAPMFSNRATINEVLPANSRKTFKKIKAGYLNAIPQEVQIDIVTAVPFSR